MRYARSDVKSYSPPGGGCPGHSEPADPDSPLLSVDCPVCDPHLAMDPLWAGSPEDVPLTAAEQKAVDAREKDAQFGAAQMGEALARLARQQMASDQAQAAEKSKPTRRRSPAKAAK